MSTYDVDGPGLGGEDDGKPKRLPKPKYWIPTTLVLLLLLSWWGCRGPDTTVAVTDTCTGQRTGAIDLTSAGTPPTYAWTSTDPAFVANANEDQTGLGAGTYTVVISPGGWAGSSTLTITVKEEACAGCPSTYFQPIGDLPGDGSYSSSPGDISADGWRVVGGSSGDDPLISTDGPDLNTAHTGQAFGYIRPCWGTRFFPALAPDAIHYPPGNDGSGLLGLGFLPDTTLQGESLAVGLSPDGAVAVGFSAGPNTRSNMWTATVFLGTDRLPLAMPTVLQGGKVFKRSGAHDVTDVLGGGGSGPAPGRIIVGYATTGSNHPQRVDGAHAVVWNTSGAVDTLPVPTSLAVTSSVARAISDDGSTILGIIFNDDPGATAKHGHPCIWKADASAPSGYVFDAFLPELPGTTRGTWGVGLSGDGTVAVGYGDHDLADFSHTRAVKWRKLNGAWGNAEELPALCTAGVSFALGVNYDGSVVVGTCGEWPQYKAVVWTGTTASDVVALLANASPPVTVPAGWYLQAARVSADGKTITGEADIPVPLATDPAARGTTAWVARIP